MGGVLDGFSKPLYTGWTKQDVSKEKGIRERMANFTPVLDESLQFDSEAADEGTAWPRHANAQREDGGTAYEDGRPKRGKADPPPRPENSCMTKTTPQSVAAVGRRTRHGVETPRTAECRTSPYCLSSPLKAVPGRREAAFGLCPG